MAMDWSGIPRPCELTRASRWKLVVTSVSVGIPSRSKPTESRTLRDVQDPQSACETITRSGWHAAIASMVSGLSSRGDTDSGRASQYLTN